MGIFYGCLKSPISSSENTGQVRESMEGEKMLKQSDPQTLNTPLHYFRRSDAATYVRTTYGFPCSRQWLAKLAVIGGGPIYRKAGRYPIYSTADLDAWAASRIGARRHSTSVLAQDL